MRWRAGGHCGHVVVPDVTGPLALLRAMLPDTVACAGGRVTDLQAALRPEEETALTRARTTRRQEFIAGRTAARAALAQLGLPDTALPRDPTGPVLWPQGVTGAISHGGGWALAAVARTQVVTGIGVDIELAGASVPVEEIASAREIAALAGRDPIILFSAKEAVYKAQFPQSRKMLSFHDLAITFDASSLTAQFLVEAPPFRIGDTITGHWAQDADVVITTALIPAARPKDRKQTVRAPRMLTAGAES